MASMYFLRALNFADELHTHTKTPQSLICCITQMLPPDLEEPAHTLPLLFLTTRFPWSLTYITFAEKIKAVQTHRPLSGPNAFFWTASTATGDSPSYTKWFPAVWWNICYSPTSCQQDGDHRIHCLISQPFSNSLKSPMESMTWSRRERGSSLLPSLSRESSRP